MASNPAACDPISVAALIASLEEANAAYEAAMVDGVAKLRVVNELQNKIDAAIHELHRRTSHGTNWSKSDSISPFAPRAYSPGEQAIANGPMSYNHPAQNNLLVGLAGQCLDTTATQNTFAAMPTNLAVTPEILAKTDKSLYQELREKFGNTFNKGWGEDA